ncbi:MAG: helix-turn-helix domain-containing protein [Pyrinomonadaceae bacterium]|nr:helix-turn-helix domain-containing protein [Pyrinomonadaceae bacterium]
MFEVSTVKRKKAYSIKEVSEETSLSQPFVRLEIKRGNLKAARFGSRVLITENSLSQYLNKGENDEQK